MGRIKHERVKVPRGDEVLLDWAMQVMRIHDDRKAILEVEFLEEEGTGLGPTLEFFALVASELQRKDLGMWICDDEQEMEEDAAAAAGEDGAGGAEDKDDRLDKKPPGYYVRRAQGLFPAPLPQEGDLYNSKVTKMFWFLGVFLAKTLQVSSHAVKNRIQMGKGMVVTL